MHTVPDGYHALDPFFGGLVQVRTHHDGILPEIYMAVHHGIRKVLYVGICGDGIGDAFAFAQVRKINLLINALNMLDRFGQLLGKLRSFQRMTGGFAVIPVHSVIPNHFAKYHFRVRRKKGVQRDAVLCFFQVHPIRLHFHGPIPPLKEDNVRGDFCSGVPGKGVVGQADRAKQIGPLGQVFAHLRGFGVHGIFGGDKCDDTTGPHLIQRFGKKVVVDVKAQLVIGLIQHLVIAKGHVADGHIIEIPAICGFKASHLDIGMGIKLLGDPARYAVQLRAV